MNKEDSIIGMVIEETTEFSFIDVCHKYHMPKELLIEMIEQGLFSNQSSEIEQLALNPKSLRKIECAIRLHRDLGVNLPGAILAVELLEEMNKMRDELDILRRHF